MQLQEIMQCLLNRLIYPIKGSISPISASVTVTAVFLSNMTLKVHVKFIWWWNLVDREQPIPFFIKLFKLQNKYTRPQHTCKQQHCYACNNSNRIWPMLQFLEIIKLAQNIFKWIHCPKYILLVMYITKWVKQ